MIINPKFEVANSKKIFSLHSSTDNTKSLAPGSLTLAFLWSLIPSTTGVGQVQGAQGAGASSVAPVALQTGSATVIRQDYKDYYLSRSVRHGDDSNPRTDPFGLVASCAVGTDLALVMEIMFRLGAKVCKNWKTTDSPVQVYINPASPSTDYMPDVRIGTETIPGYDLEMILMTILERYGIVQLNGSLNEVATYGRVTFVGDNHLVQLRTYSLPYFEDASKVYDVTYSDTVNTLIGYFVGACLELMADTGAPNFVASAGSTQSISADVGNILSQLVSLSETMASTKNVIDAVANDPSGATAQQAAILLAVSKNQLEVTVQILKRICSKKRLADIEKSINATIIPDISTASIGPVVGKKLSETTVDFGNFNP